MRETASATMSTNTAVIEPAKGGLQHYTRPVAVPILAAFFALSVVLGLSLFIWWRYSFPLHPKRRWRSYLPRRWQRNAGDGGVELGNLGRSEESRKKKNEQFWRQHNKRRGEADLATASSLIPAPYTNTRPGNSSNTFPVTALNPPLKPSSIPFPKPVHTRAGPSPEALAIPKVEEGLAGYEQKIEVDKKKRNHADKMRMLEGRPEREPEPEPQLWQAEDGEIFYDRQTMINRNMELGAARTMVANEGIRRVKEAESHQNEKEKEKGVVEKAVKGVKSWTNAIARRDSQKKKRSDVEAAMEAAGQSNGPFGDHYRV